VGVDQLVEQWVFGMVDTSHTPALGYMELVPPRNPTTLQAWLLETSARILKTSIQFKSELLHHYWPSS